MRPGSNKRMRGRNRRGPNPLARSYESNGPDVKVRGTAQHIADRYLQLARDAQSSGDPVTAENYFQHAEHYLRIIAAAQEQMQAQYGYRPPSENANDEDGEGDEGEAEGFAAPYGGGQQNGGFNGQQRQGPRPPGMNGPDADDPQPPMFSAPRERFDNRNQRDNWNRQNRDGNRFDNRQNNNRHDNNRHDNQRRDNYRRDAGPEGSSSEFAGEGRSQPRGYGEGERQGFEPRRFDRQNGQGGQGGQSGQGQHGGGEGREERQPRFERAQRPAQEEQVLPSFITAPVRPPVAVSEPEPVEAKPEAKVEALAEPAAEGTAPAPRRRGRPRRVVEAAPEAESAAAPADDTSPVSAK